MFLLILLLSIAFGWYAKKFGFTTMWIALFNAVISIYLGVMLIPTIVAYIPAFSSVYAKVMCGFGISLFLFVIAQYAVIISFENALDVTMPEMFSKIGAIVSGVLLSLIVMNFFMFNVVSMLSVSNPDSGWVKSVSAQKAYSITHSVCNFVHRLGAQPEVDMPAEAMKWYAAKPKKEKENKNENEDQPPKDDDGLVELL